MFMFRAKHIKCDIGFVEAVPVCRSDIIALCRQASPIVASKGPHNCDENSVKSSALYIVRFMSMGNGRFRRSSYPKIGLFLERGLGHTNHGMTMV